MNKIRDLPIICFPIMAGTLAVIGFVFGWYQKAHGVPYDLASYIDFVKWFLMAVWGVFTSHSSLNTAIPGFKKEGNEK